MLEASSGCDCDSMWGRLLAPPPTLCCARFGHSDRGSLWFGAAHGAQRSCRLRGSGPVLLDRRTVRVGARAVRPMGADSDDDEAETPAVAAGAVKSFFRARRRLRRV